MSLDRVERQPDDCNAGLAPLLSRCPPWTSPTDLAREVLHAGMSCFAVNRWWILWSEPHVATVRALDAAASPNQTVSSTTIARSGILSPKGLSYDELPASLGVPNDIQWAPVLLRNEHETAEVAFGFCGAENEQVSTDWMRAAAQLLSWSVEFQRQLHHQRLESMAEYAAGAGHEINNPLGSIIGRAAQLLKEETDPERRRLVETIGAQAYRIRDMIGDTMLFGRPPVPKLESCALAQTIRQVERKFRSQREATGTVFSLHCDESFTLAADAVQLEIVIAELLRNSLFELPSGGKVEVTCTALARRGVDGIQIDISDSGAGLDADQRLHCFDPFYSGRQAGRGHGFGLSKCWQILRQHGGSIEFLAETPLTTFRLWWPVASRSLSQQ